MLIEQIDFTLAELNSGSLTKQTTDYTPTTMQDENGNIITARRNYRPRKIKVKNDSGVDAKIGMWTEYEHEEWDSDPALSVLLDIEDSEALEFEPLGEISYVTASGTVGHTGNVSFILMRE